MCGAMCEGNPWVECAGRRDGGGAWGARGLGKRCGGIAVGASGSAFYEETHLLSGKMAARQECHIGVCEHNPRKLGWVRSGIVLKLTHNRERLYMFARERTRSKMDGSQSLGGAEKHDEMPPLGFSPAGTPSGVPHLPSACGGPPAPGADD